MGEESQHSDTCRTVSLNRAADDDNNKQGSQKLICSRDHEYLESLVPEVEAGVQGRRVLTEGEDDEPATETDKQA